MRELRLLFIHIKFMGIAHSDDMTPSTGGCNHNHRLNYLLLMKKIL